MAQHLTLDFGSGHDLMVRRFEPQVRLHTDSAEPAWDSLPLPPSLKINLKKKKRRTLKRMTAGQQLKASRKNGMGPRSPAVQPDDMRFKGGF